MSRSFYRYVIVGLLGAVSHISTLTILVEIGRFHPVLGSILGFLVALGLSYWLNCYWSFEQSKQPHQKAIFRYIVVSVMGLCLNTLIMFGLINWAGMGYLLAQMIAAVVVPFHNFILNFYWTFQNR
jgi:putative flippase GtrA